MTLKRGGSLFFLGAALLFLDFFSKFYVHQNIPLISLSGSGYPYGGIPVFQNFLGVSCSIVHAMNKGAAWGMLASLQIFLLYLRIAIIGGLFIYFLFFNKDRARDFPYVCILAGAIGNVVDFFVYGQVVDMIYFTFGPYSYPIFNVADSAIFCGVAFLLLQSFWSKKKKRVKTLS